MLFILRQLRRLELRKRSGRYFVYAFGEIVLIVVGILLALQVNDWQQGRILQKREALYLDRVGNELAEAAELYANGIARLQEHRDAVALVNRSFQAQVLADEDETAFRTGILKVDALSTLPHPITIYDEMVATGMFSQLQDEELRLQLTSLNKSYESAIQQLEYYRVGLVDVKATLNTLVEFYTVPEELVEANGGYFGVRYDFDRLKKSQILKNQYVEAVDSHWDWWREVNQLYTTIQRCKKRVEELRKP